ncbi:response regulator transcription factor [Streptococcus massiliensis]|uniref:Response regulator n=1 Tax=Streptococcus massiliensis TaxID=313439 RepID=A0A380KYJ3_9STRE|nr:response regulator transcription factor [Streptococcus massiliensis]SUN76695.1 response regulator [Streptococcus massiliensis]
MAKKILLIEQEKNLGHFLSLELQKEGLVVERVTTNQEGLELAKEKEYDLFLLGLNLADMSVSFFAEKLAEFRPASVIIVMAYPEDLTGREEEVQRFAVAAVRKPVLVSQLVDKISAIFRGRDFIDQHCSQMRVPTSYRNLRIDVQNHLVYRGDELISLTRREYDLLATLMGSNQTLTREQLLDRVWKYESATETNVVDVYIRYLRGKIDLPHQKSYIKTVRGVGYAMQE